MKTLSNTGIMSKLCHTNGSQARKHLCPESKLQCPMSHGSETENFTHPTGVMASHRSQSSPTSPPRPPHLSPNISIVLSAVTPEQPGHPAPCSTHAAGDGHGCPRAQSSAFPPWIFCAHRAVSPSPQPMVDNRSSGRRCAADVPAESLEGMGPFLTTEPHSPSQPGPTPGNC